MTDTMIDAGSFEKQILEFLKAYMPDDPLFRDQFEMDLRVLLHISFTLGQRPFIKELDDYRSINLKQSALKPLP